MNVKTRRTTSYAYLFLPLIIDSPHIHKICTTTTTTSMKVTLFSQRNWRRPYQRADCYRNRNGVVSVSNKVVDGNIMLFIGKFQSNTIYNLSPTFHSNTVILLVSRVVSSVVFSFFANINLTETSIFFLVFFSCRPEPHILLFRRPLGTDPQSGRVDPEMERKAREEYRAIYLNRK